MSRATPHCSSARIIHGAIRPMGGYRAFRSIASCTRGQLDRSEWSLIEVPKLQVYKGTVWASWDPEAPDFMTYLGDVVDHLDQVLDCRDGRPGGSEVIGVHKWILPANWKFAAENFLGDTYHNPSHRSVDIIGIGPSARAGQPGRRDNEYNKGQHVWVSFPQGHGVHSVWMPEGFDYQPSYMQYPDRRRVFSPLFPGAQAASWRQGAHYAVHRQFVSEHVLSRAPAPRPMRLASAQPDRNRSLALLPGRCRRAGRGKGRFAPFLHALFRPSGNDRAGRYGELAVCDEGEHGNDRAPISLQLSTVDGCFQTQRSYTRRC